MVADNGNSSQIVERSGGGDDFLAQPYTAEDLEP